MNKDIKTLILKEIENSKVEIGKYIGFTIDRKFYLYSKESGQFYSYIHKVDNIMVVKTMDSLGILHLTVDKEDDIPYCKRHSMLIDNGKIDEIKVLKPLLSLRGGKDGCSYIGLTFYKEGYKVTFNAQTIVGLLKFGYNEMESTFGSGSKYVIDHINNEKTYNAWNNIQILTRRDNRWGK